MLLNGQNLKALYTGYSSAFNKAFQATESYADKVATLLPSTGSEENHSWMGSFPVMREWVGDRVLNNPEAFSYTIKNRTFESTFRVSREDIEDDKYGVSTPLATRLGELSKLHPDELIFDLLSNGHNRTCYDGQYFFDTDHPAKGGVISNMMGTPGTTGNPWFLLDTSKMIRPFIFQKRRDYKFTALTKEDDQNVFMNNEFVYGVDARVNAGYGLWQFAFAWYGPLTKAAYEQARWNMRSMKDASGRPLHVNPNTLVVPPEHEAAARELLFSDVGDMGASNANKGTAELIVSSWLEGL